MHEYEYYWAVGATLNNVATSQGDVLDGAGSARPAPR
jgi:hypothetical protein